MKLNEWKEAKLGDDVDLISGQHILEKYCSDDPTKTPYLTGPADFQSGSIVVSKFTSSPKAMCQPDDILVTVKGDGAGSIILSDGFYCISRQLMAIRTKKWHSSFLFFWMRFNAERYRREAVGLIPGISRKDILSTQIYIPPPSEQKRIADILANWARAIEYTERLIAAKSQHKHGLMQLLLTGKKRFKEFISDSGIHSTRFGLVPNDWAYVHIEDVGCEVSEKNSSGKTLPVLSCTKHQGLVDSLKYFGKRIFSEDTSTYKIVKRGQFAYATNHIEEGSIGYQSIYDEALISPMYTVFETKGEVDHAFFYCLLKTELYRHIFEINTIGSIDRRGALRWNDFAKIKVALPSIAEQRRIAEVLNACDREIELLRQQLDALRRQKRGLMQKLLTGQIRVRVDETASADR
jgi:type I restriction enzyme S subunit